MNVLFIGDVCLILDTGFKLDLKNVCYVPFARRNILSVSEAGKYGFEFWVKPNNVLVLYDNKIIGNCILSYGLYKLCLSSNEICSTSYNIEHKIAKRPLTKEKSSMLWHKRLGHISRERVERLIKDNILPTLDFSDLETCIDCCRGKLTKIKKKGSTRSSNLLEVIHTDISGPYSPTICSNKYFITFIDDFSRYGYLFLIKEKSKALDKFKIFKTEVEK